MSHAAFHLWSPLLNLVPVQNVQVMHSMVAESDLLTGQSGRAFIVAGTDRITYQVRLCPDGYEVEQLDGEGRPLSKQYVSAHAWAEHSLGGALRRGQLYTVPLV